MSAQIEIIVAVAADFPAVTALIIDGLTRRWGNYEPSYNPDLIDFAGRYGAETVLVARAEGVLVGCGILVRESAERACLVRMSVAHELHGRGIGRVLLDALVTRARAAGLREIVCETTTTWDSAVALYTRHGFAVLGERDGDTHFRLVL